MEERRKLKRKYLMYYARVYDRKTGEMLGYLVDITPQGAMILSEEQIPTGQDYRLRLDLPEDLSKKGTLDFEGRSVWSKPDIDPKYYGTGFEIWGLSEQDKSLIERIVQQYGLHGS